MIRNVYLVPSNSYLVEAIAEYGVSSKSVVPYVCDSTTDFTTLLEATLL